MRQFAEQTPMSNEPPRSGGDKNPDGLAVAVVDDDAAVCESTSFLLETYDIKVRTYLSGDDFLKDAPEIACLIVDYHMPGFNGLEFVSELRKHGSQVPAIMITATVDATIERRAAELGIKRVLQKPLSKQVLLGAIQEQLQ